MAEANIGGWDHTKFGRLSRSREDIIIEVAREAIDHTQVDPAEIDGIWLCSL